MSIPGSKQWLEDTSLTLKPRSAKLKAVDEAILQYEKSKNEKNLWRVKNAFEDWKRYKGLTWQQSERNRKKAVTNLSAELDKLADYRTYQITHFSMEELMALSFVAKERKRVLSNIFKDKQVNFKAAKLKDQLTSSGQKVKETSQQASAQLASAGKTAQASGVPTSVIVQRKMQEMASKLFGVEGLELVGELGGFILKILAECSVTVAPVVGHIKDGYDLFTGWAKVGSGLYEQYSISECNYVIETGAPSAAFGALQECLKTETQNQVVSATAATSAFALKTGLAFLDGGAISGPVVGAAKALADFSHKLYLLGTEWRATKAINKSLAGGELDIRLFKTYPLMGCYLMVSATLSDLIPVESFGTPGWMDYIENMKKHAFDDIYKSATGLIEQSPWEIMGLPKRPKGTSAGYFAEAKRIFSTVSPLSDLSELRSLKS